MKPGETVCLYYCPACVSNEVENEVTISGLFVIEEFWPYEPSNYVWSPFYTVARKDNPDDLYDVDVYALLEQVEPKTHGRLLEQEREMEFANE
jgi:hypothetical protein